MVSKIIIDTSAWMAYYLSDEPDHIHIKSLIKGLIKKRAVITTSNDIIDETVTNLVYINTKIAKKYIEFILESITKGLVLQLWVDEQTQAKAFRLVEKFAEHKLSLTDATIIVLMKKFSIDSVISLNSDFRKVGINTIP